MCQKSFNQRLSKKTHDDDVICANCKEHHPANYRGCIVHKQLQQKLYPTLRDRTNYSRVTQPGVTYAQITKPQVIQPIPFEDQSNLPTTSQPVHEFTELKQMMKQLMDQMGTLLNLITALIAKTP